MLSYKLICILGIIFIFSPWSQAEETSDVDYLSLAGRLVHDGDYQRAENILHKIPASEQNRQEYILVDALLHLYQERFSKALIGFRKLIHQGLKDRYLYIYQGQAYYGLGEYENTLKSFSQVQDLVNSISSTRLIMCRSQWALGKWEEAWQELHMSLRAYPGDFRFAKLKNDWLLSKGLHHQAYLFSLAQIKNPYFNLEKKVTLAATFRQQGLIEESIKILELLRLEDGRSLFSTIQLAYSYIKKGHFYNGARLFEEASRSDAKYAFEAAELYRRSGQHHMALLLNRRIQDQEKKFTQRLTILISQEEYEQAAATESDLRRLGLLEKEEIRYALAFALFKSRQFEKMEYHLSLITESRLFEKAVALRQEMIKCQSTSSCV